MIDNPLGDVIWVGVRPPADELKSALGQAGIGVRPAGSVNQARTLAESDTVLAVLVDSEAADAGPVWRCLAVAAPHLPLIAVTSLGVPPHLQRLFGQGFEVVVDLLGDYSADIAGRVERICRRTRAAAQERAMLRRLRRFHDQFVSSFVHSELRYVKLTDQLAGGALPPDIEPKPRIIVVDDEPMILELFKAILDTGEYELATADDAEAAIVAFDAAPFDLVITDKNLPGMNGMDLMRAVRERRPETAVIVVTGYASMASAIEAVNLGASAYLEKPFDTEEVLQLVKKQIAKQGNLKRNLSYLEVVKGRNHELLSRYKELTRELDQALAAKSSPTP